MPVALVEFIAPLRRGGRRNQCLAVLYYQMRYCNADAMTVTAIREALVQARVPHARNINVSQVLGDSGHYVDAVGADERGHRRWRLTVSGEAYVRNVLGLRSEAAQITADVASLSAVAAEIGDEVARSYVEEAILCLGVEALKATVVFLWSGAMRSLQEKAFSVGAVRLSAAVQRHDQRARPVGKVEDLGQVKDRVVLLSMRDLGLLDKAEWEILQSALDLRNQCGHPGRYRPGVKKISSFVEDVVGIAFR